MKPVVYLAGHINFEVTETMSWREHVTKHLEPGFEVLIPGRGEQIVKPSSGDIIHRDFSDVFRSDVVIMHFDRFGSPRPIVGTFAEMGWCWYLRKPIVGISKADDPIRNSPFVTQAVTTFFDSVSDAADFVATFYGRWK